MTAVPARARSRGRSRIVRAPAAAGTRQLRLWDDEYRAYKITRRAIPALSRRFYEPERTTR